MTSSVLAGAIAIWAAVQILLRKKIGWFDAILILTLGYICGSSRTAIGGLVETGISWFTTAFNFVASWFE